MLAGAPEEWGIRAWISDAIGIPAWGITTGLADVMAFSCPHGTFALATAIIVVALVHDK